MYLLFSRNTNKNDALLRIASLLVIVAMALSVLAAIPGVSLAATAPQTAAAAPQMAPSIPQAGPTCQTLQPGPDTALDSYIKQEKQDERRGGDSEMKVKTENGKLMRSLLQFDLSFLPPGSNINSATLSLWVKEAKDGNATISAHQVTKSWKESEVTWKARDKAANLLWTNLGGDYNAAALSSHNVVKDVRDYWATWNVTTAAAAWAANPANNFGVILESPVTNPKNETKFKSSDDGTASQRPKLEICYGPGLTVDPDNSGDGAAGATKTYAHVITIQDITTIVNLTVSSSKGWATRIYKDVNGNGLKDDPDDTQITSTPAIGPSASYPILVQIDIPFNAPQGTVDVTTVTGTAQANNTVYNSATDTTRIGRQLTVAPNHNQYATAGTVLFYGHAVTNNGDNQDCVNISGTSSQGWNLKLWEDLNHNGVHETSNPNEPALANPVCLAPSETFYLVAELTVPSGAAAGVIDNTEINAVSGNNSGLIGSAVDTTQVFVNAPPVIDGKYDDIYKISPDAQEVCYLSEGKTFGKLASFYQASGDSVYFVLAIDKGFVDNTYGVNEVDWPGGHTFGNLTGSDHAQFQGFDANGNMVLDYKVDYVTSTTGTPSGYASLGVTGGEGDVNMGNSADVLAWGTSFDYDLNDLGYCTAGNCTAGGTNLEVDSPATDSIYTPNPTYPDWIFDVIYEVRVKKSAFGAAGFGAMDVPYIHASPSKAGTNTIYAEPGPCPGEIGDFVWNDLDHDGAQDPGEPGIDNVNVQLYRDNGDGLLLVGADTLAGTLSTSGGGKYLFPDLAPGDYFVDVVDASVPAGYISTTFNDPTPVINLAEGQSYLLADFGYTEPYAQLKITKEPTNPGPFHIGEQVDFSITIENVGSTIITFLPLQDSYDPTTLSFLSATPATADNTNDGALNWTDLTTTLGDLQPGQSVTVAVHFQAMKATANALLVAPTADVASPARAPSAPKAAEAPQTVGPAMVSTVDTCGYPYSSGNALTSVVFNESEVLRAFDPVTGGIVWPGQTLKVWYNDEHALTLGVRQVVVKSGSGTTTTNYPITPLNTNPGSAIDPQVGVTSLSGNQAGTDISGRPMWPTIFITDITANPNSTSGDWQFGGTALTPHAVFGSWKGAVRNVDTTKSPAEVSVTPDADPAKNDWNLGGGDPAPAGLRNEGFGAEARWDVDQLIADGVLIPGHKYRFQFMVHDGDQNKTGGDVGEACTNIELAAVASIGNRVFYDLNSDGLPDNDNDPGINDVAVRLYAGACPAVGNPLSTQITSGNGDYNFTNLSAGAYCVDVDESTLPANYGLTTNNQPLTVNLASSQNFVDADFGYEGQCPDGTLNVGLITGAIDQTGSTLPSILDDACVVIKPAFGAIGDFVWYDADKDGIEDIGEPGIPNVKVNLYQDTNNSGALDAGDNLVDTLYTDADGGYLFKNLSPAVYFVDITDAANPNGPLNGLTHTVANQSKPDPTAGINLGAGQVYKDADFGYVQVPNGNNALIGDTVWWDDNADGIQQPWEPGIPGITVCASLNGSGPLICDLTDSNGHYLIEVAPGLYYVEPGDPPIGYVATTLTPHVLGVAAGEQYLGADFGYDDDGQNLLGSIGNLVFNDPNQNGVFGVGDSPLGGVSVDLIRDSDNDGAWDAGEPIIATTTTSTSLGPNNSNYLFTGLTAGRYLVHVSDTNAVLIDFAKSPLGATGVDNNNQKDPYAINLLTGADNSTADFGYNQVAQEDIGLIGNQVWVETDGDGLFDPLNGDVGQAGVTVDLYRNGLYYATTTTGASGDYAFVHLPAGQYSVRVTDTFGVLTGYIVTTLGPNQGQDNNNQLQPYAVNLPQAGVNLTADFGYIRPGAIGDFVYYDANKDGIQDVGEPGIPNVALDLYRDTDDSGDLSAGDDLVVSTVTDADGGYLFSHLIPGDYLVDVRDASNPNGPLGDKVHTLGSQSVDDPAGVISLPAGEVYKDADFGYVKEPTNSNNAFIGDTVWYDDSGDGIQQPWEPGIPGIIVCATPIGGGGPICQTTDSNGHYLIEAPAGPYNVAPTNPPAGYTATTPAPHAVSLVPGQQYLDADFGYDDTNQNLLGTIGNLVFRDANKNGVFGVGDSPLGGVSVDLIRDNDNDSVWDAGEPIIATTTTNSVLGASNSNYQFTGLPAGRYLVHVSDTNAVLTDFVKSPLGPNPSSDNNNQPDPYAANLAVGADILIADFGYYQLTGPKVGLIGNQVWIETDGNGLFNPANGDFGQPGVTVDLYRNGLYYATTTTGASGDYSFPSLPAGNYTVDVTDTYAVLAGYILTRYGPNPGQDNNHQLQPYAINLPVGGFNLTADFGYIRPGAIGDLVWLDADADAIQDVGEPGIPNVAVRLYEDKTGNGLTPDDTLLQTLITDADGGYLFRDLLPGRYVVDVRDASNPNGPLGNLAHTLGMQSSTDPSGVITLGAAGVHKDADFGYTRDPGPDHAIIGDTVWYDDNSDGVQQPGEPGIPGIEVCATPADNSAPFCTTTDDNGHYLLVVPQGTYTVEPTNPPAGLNATTPTPHGPQILLAGDVYLNADFGYDDDPNDPQLGVIGNLVFLDPDRDGILGGGDSPLGGVSVDLIRDSDNDGVWDAGEPIIATVTTDSNLGPNNANYLFTGLVAGDYLVHVSDTNGILLDFVKSPLGVAGNDGHNQSDPYAINLPVAGSDLTADFGYFKPNLPRSGVIGNQVWVEGGPQPQDNGFFDVIEGDIGQHGVTVELLRNGQVIATTTTGASGDYAFLHLPGGDYEVRITDAAGVLTGLDISAYPDQTIDHTNKIQSFGLGIPDGGVNLIADFGYYDGSGTGQQDSVIGNLVWNDTNGDGMWQAGEQPIGNVTVQLWYDSNKSCTLESGDVLVGTRTTSANIVAGGNYRYSIQLIPGNYLVLVTDANNVLASYAQTVGPNPGQDNNSQSPQPYCIENFNPNDQGDTNLTADFGYLRPQSGFKVSKTLNGVDPFGVSEAISFTITITNIGNTWIGVLPLKDVYNTAYLTYGFEGKYAFPASTNTVNDGQIDWNDLTVSFGTDLAPGATFTVVVWFTAFGDTTALLPDGRTPNTAIVSNALADPDGPGGPQPPSEVLPQQEATARVKIIQPTGLRLEGLQVTPEGDRVRVSWRTLSEANILGFNILRSRVTDVGALDESGFTAINTALVFANRSGMDAGDAYEYLDQAVEQGATYRYRLQVVKLDGTTEWFGLGEVTLGQVRIFAPMVIR